MPVSHLYISSCLNFYLLRTILLSVELNFSFQKSKSVIGNIFMHVTADRASQLKNERDARSECRCFAEGQSLSNDLFDVHVFRLQNGHLKIEWVLPLTHKMYSVPSLRFVGPVVFE